MPLQTLCVHAHFYQPPREDPVTGTIPQEPGAVPYHNWNEKIHAECYRPNAELGNFRRISFNIGPTLCEWMEDYDPKICQQIVSQDRANLERYGVGNAIAQAYNHTILPLASYSDKVTQVRWGIADFVHRFGRKPQGLWLPETAVDTETLEVLADHGIEFTILAPWQADTEYLDPTEPYRVPLSRGRSITVFFYNRELSTKVSFDPWATTNADIFARNDVVRHFNPEKLRAGDPQVVMIASDGELYGHHQQFRDRFLARLVDGAVASQDIQITYPALWLKHNQPKRTMSIKEKTSWSCHHGVLRWSGDCSCTPGDGRWKHNLRSAFDQLAYLIDKVYHQAVEPYISDPLELRNRYIEVMLGEMPVRELIDEMAGHRLEEESYDQIIKLLEVQRLRQRIFTSCGWFFEDFYRIEPKLVVTYAAQAVWLTRQATGVDLSAELSANLKHVTSNSTGLRADVYLKRQLERMDRLDVQLKLENPDG